MYDTEIRSISGVLYRLMSGVEYSLVDDTEIRSISGVLYRFVSGVEYRLSSSHWGYGESACGGRVECRIQRYSATYVPVRAVWGGKLVLAPSILYCLISWGQVILCCVRGQGEPDIGYKVRLTHVLVLCAELSSPGILRVLGSPSRAGPGAVLTPGQS